MNADPVKASGKWRDTDHVWETLNATLHDRSNLNDMEIPLGRSDGATKVLMLSWHIAAKRLWTLSKHDAPPESFAEMLSGNDPAAQRVANLIKRQHLNFLALEHYRHDVPDAMTLWKDLAPLLKAVPVRLIFELFCRDNYRPTSVSGLHLLKGHLFTMPDNKLVEDIHHPLRLNARANSNKRMAANEIQKIQVDSEVLERRGVKHAPTVTKEAFVQEFKTTPATTRLSIKHESKTHRLPNTWSGILHPYKTWATLSEDALYKTHAGWQWLDAFVNGRGTSLPARTKIGDGRLSKTVLPFTIIQPKEDRKEPMIYHIATVPNLTLACSAGARRVARATDKGANAKDSLCMHTRSVM